MSQASLAYPEEIHTNNWSVPRNSLARFQLPVHCGAIALLPRDTYVRRRIPLQPHVKRCQNYSLHPCDITCLINSRACSLDLVLGKANTCRVLHHGEFPAGRRSLCCNGTHILRNHSSSGTQPLLKLLGRAGYLLNQPHELSQICSPQNIKDETAASPAPIPFLALLCIHKGSTDC